MIGGIRIVLPTLVLLLTCLDSVGAHEKAYIPKPGGIERRAIVDTLREQVQTELDRPVIFKIDHLEVLQGWAFLRGTPLLKTGEPMDYQGTPYQSMIDSGMFDDWICALLRRREKQWEVVKYVIGASDVPFVTWAEQFHAPRDIFR